MNCCAYSQCRKILVNPIFGDEPNEAFCNQVCWTKHIDERFRERNKNERIALCKPSEPVVKIVKADQKNKAEKAS